MNTSSESTESPTTEVAENNAAGKINTINHVIAVMSSKGGVGKSFVTGLMACGLAGQGYRVGILDADFTGSSIPMLFGLQGPVKIGQYSFLPHESKMGIKIISTNLLSDRDDDSIIWKEALMGQVIEQLWREVEWGTLDYLIIDMPTATSEVAVAVMQSLPLTGAVIVTTPQMISTRIVNKTIHIAQKLGVPILGVVENMAYYLCPGSGRKEYIFGQSRVESIAYSAKAPILASLPLNPEMTAVCDFGMIEEADPAQASELAKIFLTVLTEFLEQNPSLSASSLRNANRSYFSDIVIGLVKSKENVGELENPDAQGLYLGSCGDRMQIDLRVVDGRITDARFTANGCAATFACGSMITRMATTKPLQEVQKITAEDLIQALGGLPLDHQHCAELAVLTLREAVIDAIEGHRNRPKNVEEG